MGKKDMSNIMKLVIFTASILLLASCTLLSPVSQPDSTSPKSNRSPVKGTPQEIKPSLRFKLDPSQSIEINGLKINYNMIAVPNEDGYFIRLSLVLTNQNDQSLSISPKVTLLDAREGKVDAFTKDGFLLATSHMTENKHRDVINSLIETNINRQNSAQERMEWANTYWLKNEYRIPPHGIALGGIVYHSAMLILPMKLTVSAAGQEFVFATNDSLQVINRQYKDAHRLFDTFIGVANSNSGITAYVIPSTIRKNGDKVEMWSLFDFKTAETAANGQTYQSARSLKEYDCKEEQSRLLAFSWHSGNMGAGNVVFNNADIQKWESISPDSLEGFIWKYACWKQ